MVNVCLTCGDAGFSNALISCDGCKVYYVHLYCLAEVPTDFDDVVWLCEDCDPEARKLSLLDKLSPGSDSLGSVQVKKDSGRKLKKISNRKVSSELLNGPKLPDLEKSPSIQLDLENIRKGQEYEGHIGTDDKLELGECKELKLNFSDNGEKDEHGEKYQNHNGCNNLDEVSLNAEAILLKTESHQLALTRSPDIYAPAQPIEHPIWRGHLCIPDEHFDGMLELVAHLSNLACPKVGEEAKSLPLLLSPELLPRSSLWPKSFVKWGPTDDSIALYFFPDSESSERVFDSLVNDMISRDVGMKAVVQNAELLIFASTLMPMDFWRFQAKFYLWGVFRRKRCGRSAAVANGDPVPVPGEVRQVSDRHSPISPLSNTDRTITSKNIMVELNRGEKLNGDNYKIWSMKIRYILEEQEALEAINKYMDEPEEGTTSQHKRDWTSYDAWRKKNSLARIILLSNMCKDRMREFNKYYLAKDIWSAVAKRFGASSMTRVHSLTIKFDSCEKLSCHTIKKHLRQMTEICHEEREDDRLKLNKSSTDVYMRCSSSQGRSWKKRKFQEKGDKEEARVNKIKRFNKLENGKHLKCFNCGNMGHFARDCIEPKKRLICNRPSAEG